jgi:pimeloyl-[acyl-carrier protein] methyl ester esterase
VDVVYINGWGFGDKDTPPSLNKFFTVKKSFSCDSIFSDSQDSPSDFLKNQMEDETPCIIMGWSLGGMLALEFASHYPELCSHLILISTTMDFVSNDPERRKSLLELTSKHKTSIEEGTTRALIGFYSSLVKEYIHFDQPLEVPSLSQLLSASRHLSQNGLQKGLQFLQNKNSLEACKGISTPTLILHGDNDTLIPFSHAESLHHAIKESQLMCIRNSGHMLPFTHTDQVISSIQDFITP